MILLIGFALLAGAGTALSPCVLPVLPALLSAGGVGGSRRPLGIVLGLSITFTVTIVGLANVVDGVGLGQRPAARRRDRRAARRSGSRCSCPASATRLEAPLSRLARFGPRTSGDGFRSGLLSAVRSASSTPPAPSPILAAVISVSAASGRTVGWRSPTRGGSAIVLLALTLGGRRLFERVRRAGRGPTLQRALGVVMIAHGPRDPRQPRRQLRPARRRKHPRRQPDGGARVLEHRHRPPARDHRPHAEVRPRQRRLGLRRLRPRSRGAARTPPRRPCWPPRTLPALGSRTGIHRNRSTGSTPPAAAR